MIRQRQRRLLAAAVGLASRFARLPRLRRIDPEQADALALNLQCVIVDDRGAAEEINRAGSCCAAQQRGDDG